MLLNLVRAYNGFDSNRGYKNYYLLAEIYWCQILFVAVNESHLSYSASAYSSNSVPIEKAEGSTTLLLVWYFWSDN